MRLLFSLLLALFLPSLFINPAYANKPQLFKVLKVIDGDTIVVDVRGNKETLRLLGIDTPETVDPRKPIQCFGKTASEKMKSFVAGKSVILVDDNTQGNRDKYKRLLRYVYLPDSKRTFVNGEMIKQGYAFSYRQYPTKMLDKFNNLEKYAREHNDGLWSSCPLNAKPTNSEKINKTNNLSNPTLLLPNNGAKMRQVTPSISSSTQSAPIYSSGGDKDCKDFKTHAEAQSYFLSKGESPTNNVDRLDADHDGVACESLP